MRWTRDEIDEIKQLKADGWGSSAIAETISVKFGRVFSPGAVLLALRRHDREAHEGRYNDRRKAVADRRANIQARSERPLTWSRLQPSHAAPGMSQSLEWYLKNKARCIPVEPPPTAAGKLFDDKTDCECSWWIGDDQEGKMRFCAEPIERGKPYCSSHYAASIRPAEEDQEYE